MQENAKEKGMPLMTFKKALIGLLIPLAVMLPMVLSGVDLLLAYFSAAFFLIIYGLILGFKWDGLSKDMIKGGAGMLEAAIIIALVGGLIGVWIISGTVPAMIYYGLKIISPKLFVPLSFLICIITSLATGSSWGTAGTVGVALFGIASGMGIPLPLTVGALISGSILGDKLSPLSDTTLLASASTNTNIFDHVVSMLYTTVPLAILSLILYAILGFKYGSAALDTAQISILINGLSESFHLGVITLLPVVLVLVLSFKRLPPMAVFGITIVASMVLAVFYQGAEWKDVFSVTVNGFSSSTGIEGLDNLLSRGGILSMMSITMLSILAGSLAGLMDHMSILKIFIGHASRGVHSPAGMVTLTTCICTGMSIAACDQYLILTLPGIAFRPSYDKMNIHSSVLSRTMEDTGTVFGSINPWHFTSTFFVGTFGVPVLSYAPFAFFPLLSPLMAILNAWLGIGLFRCSDTIKYRPFWKRPKDNKTTSTGVQVKT